MTDQQFRTLLAHLQVIIAILGVMAVNGVPGSFSSTPARGTSAPP
jgi:hypothetical protein